MSSLIDRDTTRAREEGYPSTAGAAIKQIGLGALEFHTAAQEKYIDWVQELMKRDDVHWAVKMAILGGEDPMVFGGSIPAVMMAKLEPIGVGDGSYIEGTMSVSESNKATEGAKTSVESKTDGGFGTPFWHVNEQLTVRHSNDSNQTRADEYRAKIGWRINMVPMGEPEGVTLIKGAVTKAFDIAQKISETLADAQAQKIRDEAKPPAPEDADAFLGQTDIGPSDGDAGDGGGEDKETGTGTQTDEQE